MAGLAASTSLSLGVALGMLVVIMARRDGRLSLPEFVSTGARVLTAAAIAAVAMRLVYVVVAGPDAAQLSGFAALPALAVAALAGLLLYVGALRVAARSELDEVVTALRGGLRSLRPRPHRSG